MKKSLEELYYELARYESYINMNIKHIKSGGYYKIVDTFFKEDDLSIWFSYDNSLGPFKVRFSRPVSELLDGRFEFL